MGQNEPIIIDDHLRMSLDTHLKPLDDQFTLYETGAQDFAKTILRTGLVLNGGALLALPTLLAFFDIEPEAHVKTLIWMGGLLLTGIFSSWVAQIIGFLVLCHKSYAAYYEKKQKTIQFLRANERIADNIFQKEQKLTLKELEKAVGRANLLRYFALGLVILSLTFFAVAVYLGGDLLIVN